jgi:2-polyprenyl-3-methyl-5-hydroxy-6-metoxy-1,4-benzoquinol methylase
VPRTIALTACPVCRGSDLLVGALGDARMHRCRGCGAVFAREYADPSEVYVDGYFEGETAFGVNVAHPAFRAHIAQGNRARLAALARFTSPPGRLLDVGSGMGFLLDEAAAAGWSVAGVEPVAGSAQSALDNGHDVRVALLEDAGLPEASFDVVVLSHVLEHMPDSQDFLGSVLRWLRPRGHLLVEVPNYASLARRRHGTSWTHYRPLEHIVYFTPSTLRRTLEDAGLRVRLLTSPSYLAPAQRGQQMLVDLGLPEPSWVTSRSRPQQVAGVTVPSAPPAVWRALHLVDRAFSRAGLGSVLYAVAQR